MTGRGALSDDQRIAILEGAVGVLEGTVNLLAVAMATLREQVDELMRRRDATR